MTPLHVIVGLFLFSIIMVILLNVFGITIATLLNIYNTPMFNNKNATVIITSAYGDINSVIILLFIAVIIGTIIYFYYYKYR